MKNNDTESEHPIFIFETSGKRTMKLYLVRKTKTKKPIRAFDDFIEARDFMRGLQYVELVRTSDNVILSTKTTDNGITGVGFIRLSDITSPLRLN